MKFLIDSSAWIPSLRKGGDRAAVEAVASAIESDLAATCTIVMLELLSGATTEKDFRELREELLALHFIPITETTWKSACRIGFELRRKGLTVPATDVLIAATALEAGCGVLHRGRHFDLMAERLGIPTKKV